MTRLLVRLALSLLLLSVSSAFAQAGPSVQGPVSYYAIVPSGTPEPEFRVLVGASWSQPDPGPACAGGPNWVFVEKTASNYALVEKAIMQAVANGNEVQVWASPVPTPGGTLCRIDYIRVWGVGRF
jgi:hypothetical protein